MTMIRPRFIFLLLFLPVILFCKTAFSDETDVRMRLSGKIDTDITKKFNVALEYEHRFDQYLTTFDKAFFEPSVSYKLNKKFQFDVNYRVMYDQNQVRKREFKQRVAGSIRYKFDVDDFEIKIKTALQYGFDDLTNASFSYNQKLINRNSIEVEYNWFGKKFKPFTEYEFFYYINDPNGGIINQWRLKAGTSYSLSKSSKLVCYYAFENEFNVVEPVDSHIIGFGYAYSF